MRTRLASLTLIAAGLLAQGSVHAADPKAAARALYERASKLIGESKFQEAIEPLVQADRLYHAPTVVYALGQAHVGVGKLLEAQVFFQRVVDEHLPASAPEPFRDAQQRAKKDLAALQSRIPTLRIVVKGGGGWDQRVTIDDVQVQGWSPDIPVPVNPGARRVTVLPSGGPPVSRTVNVKEGERARVEIGTSGVGESVADPPPPPPSVETRRGWVGPAVAGFSLGVVGVAVGIGAGVSALKSNSAIRKDCGGTSCPPTEQSKLSAAKGAATASTVGFVLAGVGAVTGVVLVAVRPGSRPGPATGAASPPEIGLTIGPASLGLAGRF